jgi:hypothetical protein
MSTQIAALCGTLLLITASLAQAQENRPPPQIDITGGEPPAEEACFNARQARSFSALDDRHVYIRARRDEHYLLTMFPGCVGLGSSLRIGVSQIVGRVCSNDTALVTYRGISGTDTCPIRRVEAVEDRASAQALVNFRKRAAGN